MAPNHLAHTLTDKHHWSLCRFNQWRLEVCACAHGVAPDQGRVQKMLHPHAVLPVRINNTVITSQTARTVFVFFVVYFMLIMLSTFAMVAMGLSLLDAFGLAISSFSNVGPSIGHLIGPLGSWGVLNDAILWINSFLMLAGRLEIFSLLLPLTPAFWRDE